MWEPSTTDEFERRMKHYAKKHPDELQAVLDNLDTYLKALLEGVKPLQNQHGFTHAESHGAVAIDQKGGRRNLQQTRLYVYCDANTETLYLITLGDKKSQREDNATCREFIVGLREAKQNEQDQQNPKDSEDGEGDSD